MYSEDPLVTSYEAVITVTTSDSFWFSRCIPLLYLIVH